MPKYPTNDDAQDDGQREARQGADEYVLGLFAVGWVANLCEPEDGFSGDEEADGLIAIEKNEGENEYALESADPQSRFFQTLTIGISDMLSPGCREFADPDPRWTVDDRVG
jgi:hypothetical protein